jgi:hypothetical protein
MDRGRGFCSKHGNLLGLGRAVQLDPMQSRLKAPGTKRLTLHCEEPLSSFAYKFNLRRYTSGV